MNTRIRSAMVVAVLAGVGACSNDASDAQLRVDGENNNTIVPEVAPATQPGPLTAQAWVDDFSLGRELNATGAVADEEDSFAVGDTIHLTMQVDDAPAGVAVTVQWFGPDDAPLGGETRMVADNQDLLGFTKETAQWREGDYRAEVWVGDEKVNEQRFQIVAANA